MSTPLVRHYFKCFRFEVVFCRRLDDSKAEDASMRLGAGAVIPTVWVKSFTNRRIEVGVGLSEDGESAHTQLMRELGGSAGSILVSFCDAAGRPRKKLSATFDDYEWLPLNLSSSSESVAEERLMLLGVTYAPIEDA